MIVIGLALCTLWALAIFGTVGNAGTRTSEPSDAQHEMPPALGVVLFLALLVGIVLKKRRDARDQDDD